MKWFRKILKRLIFSVSERYDFLFLCFWVRSEERRVWKEC